MERIYGIRAKEARWKEVRIKRRGQQDQKRDRSNLY